MKEDIRQTIDKVKFDVSKCNEIIAHMCEMLESNKCTEVETEYLIATLKTVMQRHFLTTKTGEPDGE